MPSTCQPSVGGVQGGRSNPGKVTGNQPSARGGRYLPAPSSSSSAAVVRAVQASENGESVKLFLRCKNGSVNREGSPASSRSSSQSFERIAAATSPENAPRKAT